MIQNVLVEHNSESKDIIIDNSGQIKYTLLVEENEGAASSVVFESTISDVHQVFIEDSDESPIDIVITVGFFDGEVNLPVPDSNGLILGGDTDGSLYWVEPYTHPNYTIQSVDVPTGQIINKLYTDDTGHITSVGIRSLTADDISDLLGEITTVGQWETVTGGIEYNGGNVDITSGNLTVTGNIIATGEIMAYADDGSVGSMWEEMPVATATTLGGVKVNASISDVYLDANNVLQIDVPEDAGQWDNVSGGIEYTGGNVAIQNGNLTISGNLTVNGTQFISNTETVEIEDNLAILNSGETGAGITAGFAGWEADRGTLTNYKWGFDEARDLWVLGEVGDTLQAVATREDNPTSGGLAQWNDTEKRFDTVNYSDVNYWTKSGDNLNYTDGNVSVGTATDYGSTLNIQGDLYIRGSDSSGLRIYEGSGGYYERIIDYDAGNQGSNLYFDANGSRRITLLNNGNFGINKTPTEKLDVDGNGLFSGNVTANGEVEAFNTSDKRLKTNINSFKATDLIEKMNPVSFNWNKKAKELNSNKDDRNNFGLIAQELEEIAPELVHPIYDDYKSIDYTQIISILVQSNKELNDRIKKLEKKIN